MAKRFDVVVHGLEDLKGPTRKIVFHGVNKSGSLALSDVLQRAYRDHRRSDQFFSHYRGIPQDRDRLLQLIDQSSGHRFFIGHSLYGAFESRPGEHLLVTQFRHPLPRVLSCYQWLKNKKVKSGDSFPGLEEWVTDTGGVVHSQVAQFAFGFASGWQHKRAAANPEQLFELSVSHISRDVHWFGIAEYFEESVFCLAALCGLPSIRAWKQDKRNKGRALTTERPDSELELIREVFAWDFALYEHVSSVFHSRLRELELGHDLSRYRAACQSQYKDRLDVSGQLMQPLPRRRTRPWQR